MVTPRRLAAALALALATLSGVAPDIATQPASASQHVEGEWTPTAPPRLSTGGQARRLSDGRIMFHVSAAGFAFYHPAEDRWTTTTMTATRPPEHLRQNQSAVHLITALWNGDALVHYGSEGGPDPIYRYRSKPVPGQPEWELVQDIDNDTRPWFPFVALIDGQSEHDPRCHPHCGKVLVAGGAGICGICPGHENDVSYAATQDTYQIYDPETNRLESPVANGIRKRIPLCTRTNPDGSPSTTRMGAAPGGQLRDGRMMAAASNCTYFYDAAKDEWTADGRWRGIGGRTRTARLSDDRMVFWNETGGGGREDYLPLFDPNLLPANPWRKISNCPLRDTSPPATPALPGPGIEQPKCGALSFMPDATPGGKGSLVALNGADKDPDKVSAWVLDLNRSYEEMQPTFNADGEVVATPWMPLPKLPSNGRSVELMAGTVEQCGANCNKVIVGGNAGAHIWNANLLEVTGLSAGRGWACGGETIEVQGRGFRAATAVNFGAERVPIAEGAVRGSGDEMTITVTTPRHPPGPVPVPVTVSNAAQTSTPNPAALFEFQAPVATVSGIEPRPEGRAAGGERRQIAGTFPAPCVRSVTFGSAPVGAGSVQVGPAGVGQPATAIDVTTPAGNPGEVVAVKVHVDPGPPVPVGTTVPSQPVSPGAEDFTYLALPAISALSPPRGPAFGGQSVTLTGTGLEGATEVRFGEAKVPPSKFSVNSAGTSISVTVPGHDPGSVPVTLTTPKRGDSLVSKAPQFTYHPGISGIFPPSGPLTGGTDVTIAGRGFTGAQAVRFGAASVVPISLTDTEIVVKTPPHGLPEAVPVSLAAAGLNSLPENVLFSYGLGDVVDPDPEIDTGTGPPKQDNTPVEPAPPGGSPAASPVNAPSPSASPTPGVAPAPGAAPTPGQAPVPGQAPLSAQVPGQSASPSNSPAALPPPIGVASPVAAPGTAVGQAGPGANQGVAGAGEDDEGQGAHRYAMSDARTTLALGAAGATGCFTFLAAARREPARRRRRSGARRPQPKGAY